MVSRAAKVAGGIVGVLVLVVAVVGGLAATGTFAQPTVESTAYQWGAVSNDSTEIRTEAVVENRLGSERVQLESLGQNTVVETDMLGQDG